MGIRQYKVLTVTLASSATLTSFIDIGRSWRHVAMELPTMNTATAVYIHGSPTSGGTFTRFGEVLATAAANQFQDFAIATGTSGRILPIEPMCQFLKFETKTAVTHALTFSICRD